MKAVKFLVTLVLSGVATIYLTCSLRVDGAVANVSVLDDYFTPATTSIHAGDTVVWTWGTDFDGHNVVSSSTPYAWLFPSPDGGPGTTLDQDNSNTQLGPFAFSNTFNATGSFPYECTPHLTDGMVGTVNVAVAPMVAITNPAGGEVFNAPAKVIIQAAASEVGGSVTKVQFLIGTNVLTNVTTAPYFAVTNNLPAGAYTLTAIATDAHAVTATQSIKISVVVGANPVVLATPTVSNGVFQFSYSSTSNLNYLVQISTNLQNWNSIATNTATTNTVSFTDTNAGRSGAFYRVELQPNP